MRIWKKKVESSLHVNDFFAISPLFLHFELENIDACHEP